MEAVGEIGTEEAEMAEDALEAETVMEEEEVEEGLEVVVEDMVEGAAMEAVEAVSRASSPVEDSDPSTGRENAWSPSRRTFTTPPAPAKMLTAEMWSSSGKRSLFK